MHCQKCQQKRILDEKMGTYYINPFCICDDKHICRKCGAEMIIDEWNGWIWACPRCEYEGRNATDKEVEVWEEEMDKIYK